MQLHLFGFLKQKARITGCGRMENALMDIQLSIKLLAIPAMAHENFVPIVRVEMVVKPI